MYTFATINVKKFKTKSKSAKKNSDDICKPDASLNSFTNTLVTVT